jgi:cytochrome c oxidase subunit 1
MPRRIPDYPDAFSGWNHISSLGSYLAFAASLLFVYIAIKTITSGERVGANYWGEGATSLEWTVDSPAPHHTHETMPHVH